MSGFQYVQVENKELLSKHVSDKRLHELYNLCFNRKPYYEYYGMDKVCAIFEKYCTNGILYLCLDEKKAIGFSAAMPLGLEDEVYKIVKEHLVAVDTYWYHADIGIDPQYEGKGIATTLLNTILNKKLASPFVARTQEENEPSKALHFKCGFKLLNNANGTLVTQDVSRDDRDKPDKRIFFVCERN